MGSALLHRAVSSPRTWFAVALVAALLFFGWHSLRGPLVHVEAVRRTDIVQTVVSTGRVITPARAELGSVIAGVVQSLAVREGETVKAGQVLARLDADELRAALAQAEASRVEAEARLAQLATLGGPLAESGLAKADQNLRLAREEQARVARLHGLGFLSASRLDEANRGLGVAQADLAAAQAQASANRPSGSEYALARARREQAQAAVALARARLAYTEIRAVSDGVVLRKYVEPGDAVQPGKRLYELAVAGETQVSLLVDEKNLALVRVGQRARVAADAYADRPVDAEVFYVAPGVDAGRGTVEVKLRIARPEPFLRPDMTVSAELLVGEARGALALPSALVRDASGVAPWVLVAREGRAVRVPVRLGLRAEGVLQIASGLAEGALAIPVQAGLKEGDRLRADPAPPTARAKPAALDIVR